MSVTREYTFEERIARLVYHECWYADEWEFDGWSLHVDSYPKEHSPVGYIIDRTGLVLTLITEFSQTPWAMELYTSVERRPTLFPIDLAVRKQLARCGVVAWHPEHAEAWYTAQVAAQLLPTRR